MSAGAIIPCYNVKREYISGVLDSVLAQTFEDYEVILVDDGSLEEYRKILEDAAQMDRRIRICSQAPWDLLSKRRKDLSVPGSAISSRF